MLFLRRKPGTTIRIGDDIVVVIKEIRDGEVHVGIQAPIDVPVHREEVYQRIKKEQESKS